MKPPLEISSQRFSLVMWQKETQFSIELRENKQNRKDCLTMLYGHNQVFFTQLSKKISAKTNSYIIPTKQLLDQRFIFQHLSSQFYYFPFNFNKPKSLQCHKGGAQKTRFNCHMIIFPLGIKCQFPHLFKNNVTVLPKILHLIPTSRVLDAHYHFSLARPQIPVMIR